MYTAFKSRTKANIGTERRRRFVFAFERRSSRRTNNQHSFASSIIRRTNAYLRTFAGSIAVETNSCRQLETFESQAHQSLLNKLSKFFRNLNEIDHRICFPNTARNSTRLASYRWTNTNAMLSSGCLEQLQC